MRGWVGAGVGDGARDPGPSGGVVQDSAAVADEVTAIVSSVVRMAGDGPTRLTTLLKRSLAAFAPWRI